MYMTGEWGHFNKKDQKGANLWTEGHFGLTFNESEPT
jgi:hypothetical protein